MIWSGILFLLLRSKPKPPDRVYLHTLTQCAGDGRGELMKRWDGRSLFQSRRKLRSRCMRSKCWSPSFSLLFFPPPAFSFSPRSFSHSPSSSSAKQLKPSSTEAGQRRFPHESVFKVALSLVQKLLQWTEQRIWQSKGGGDSMEKNWPIRGRLFRVLPNQMLHRAWSLFYFFWSWKAYRLLRCVLRWKVTHLCDSDWLHIPHLLTLQ